MGMLGGNPSTKIADLVGSFQYEENNSMVAEALEEYTLAYAEVVDEVPGKHAPIGFMASGGVFNDGNVSHWEDQKILHLKDRLNKITISKELVLICFA